jgi:hypothetical protein
MSEKMFTIAGTSTLKGVSTYRFATGKVSVREGVLKRGDHTDIKLQELPNPMTKADAIKFLEGQGVKAQLPAGRQTKVSDEEKAAAKAAHAAGAADRKAAGIAKRKATVAAKKAAAEAAKPKTEPTPATVEA